jgi:hypothetical protein
MAKFRRSKGSETGSPPNVDPTSNGTSYLIRREQSGSMQFAVNDGNYTSVVELVQVAPSDWRTDLRCTEGGADLSMGQSYASEHDRPNLLLVDPHLALNTCIPKFAIDLSHIKQDVARGRSAR